MKKCGGKTETGFTIIEVSLVLAIAGLIFLIVFLAVPALQRSSRDTRRKDDIAHFLQRVKDYQTANRGALPTSSGSTSWANFYTKYLGNDFYDPDGNKYTLVVADYCSANLDTKCTYTTPENYKLVVVPQATCSGHDAVRSDNPRKIAVLYKLEVGEIYCANS